jgi:hypothetical protein
VKSPSRPAAGGAWSGTATAARSARTCASTAAWSARTCTSTATSACATTTAGTLTPSNSSTARSTSTCATTAARTPTLYSASPITIIGAIVTGIQYFVFYVVKSLDQSPGLLEVLSVLPLSLIQPAILILVQRCRFPGIRSNQVLNESLDDPPDN